MKVNDSVRLSYSLMTANDAELLYQLDQDPAVMRYINGGKTSSMAYITKIYLPRLKSFTNNDAGWGLWKVTIKANQKFIGWILIRPMEFFSQTPEFHNLEIGWRFMQCAWGKGYATEAASTIAEQVKKQKNIKKLSAIAMADNVGSIAIMKKIGLSYVKSYLHKDPIGDMPVVYYQQQL